MSFSLREGAIAVALGMLLFFISCEKHPLGQMPEVQREQPDPAKVSSNAKIKNSDEPSASSGSAESPHEAR